MKELLQNFPKGISFCFFMFAIIFATIIRIILSYFKALAHKKGETKANGHQSTTNYFKQSFLSCSGKHEIDDHFIPFFIGLFELIMIPLLIEYSLFKEIAAWFGFKAIGTWTTQNPRTAYNRFLFGNILSLVGSYFLWKLFFL
ncbi:MAG TPA: hypothetical protein VGQ09_12890 [Chitinophagaceae bacterium]|jgi:hypothetical protein|nr:hypothetical protein [Chitinophagaceae bacterium]